MAPTKTKFIFFFSGSFASNQNNLSLQGQPAWGAAELIAAAAAEGFNGNFAF